MRIVLAPDSFKECMTAAEACAAMARGIRARVPDAEIVAAPMADGGEGTLEVLAAVISGEAVTCEVSGPLGAPVRAAYWFNPGRQLGSNQLGSNPGRQLGSNQLGSNPGRQLGSNQLGSNPGRQPGSNQLGSNPSRQPGSNQLGSNPGHQLGSNQLGSNPGRQPGSNQLGSNPSRQPGSNQLGSNPGHQLGSNQLGSNPGRQPGSNPGRGLAVIEAARAIGLGLVVPAARNPMRATSRGLGELLADALDRGARRILVTLGGSATVDGGAGMARALGYTLLAVNGAPLPEGGAALEQLARIVPPGERPWCAAQIEVACDVTNPLLGPRGAAPVFGPQKGATAEMVAQLKRGLAQLAARLSADLGVDPAPAVGAGAAGGLGAGLAAFTGARLRRGVDLVMEQIGLDEKLRGADLVLTGEGRVDRQSAEGKVCAGVGRLARSHGIPCIVLAGAVEEPLDALYEQGVTAAHCIARGPRPLADALVHAADDLAAAAGEVAQHWSSK